MTMVLNVGINGFGRIGRIIFRTCFQNPGIEVSAINDPAVDIDYICYLIKFDSTHGKFRGTVDRFENEITIDGHKIVIFREKLPTNIPWQIADVQYVVEASGMFTNLEKASGHLTSEGVKRVLVTAPSLDVPMVVLGVNDDKLTAGHKVISCASSTLYCLAPIIKILEDNFGVSEGFITSIHAMTPSLKPLDGLCLKGKHWRDHRSIHQNIIPATTGACRALGKIIPQVKDRMTGLAFRVPIVNVSVLDITIRLKSNASMEDIIRQVENAGKLRMQNIIKVSNEKAVSSDFVGEKCSCIFDVDSSLQLTSDFFKLICWYENEYSYACRIIDSIQFLEKQYQLEWKSKMSYIRPTPQQSLIQSKENHNKFTYHQASNNECYSKSGSLCSTSQDSGFKSPKRPPITKKPNPRNFSTRKIPSLKKNNEFFKIWNDEQEIVKEHETRHNRNSFFHSCIAITPQINNYACIQTRERLENVKREFSKMVIMTENLLKQSQHSKMEIRLSEVLPNNKGDTNGEMVKVCDETVFPLDKINDKTEIKATEDNSSETGFTKTIGNHNRFAFSADTINLMHSNDCSTSANGKKSYSLGELKNINVGQNSTLAHPEGDYNVKRTFDNINITKSGVPNSIKSNKYKILETIELNNDSVQEDISEYASERQNNTQNIKGIETFPISHNQNDIAQAENDKCRQNKSLKREEINSYSAPKQSEALANAFGKSAPEIIHINKCETENVQSEDNKGRNLQLRLEGVLKKLNVDSNIVSEKPSTCLSSINTITTASNRDIKQKQDIYDKLDSVSATDSENSFHMKERKSQVINITDLTSSLEDLEKLDKICRIMEISDDLSDQLLSALNSSGSNEVKGKKWSFKDLCEKIKLDEFCNKIFNKINY